MVEILEEPTDETPCSLQFGNRIAVLQWYRPEGSSHWSVNLIKKAIPEKKLLIFSGAVVYPRAWKVNRVDIHIGVWVVRLLHSPETALRSGGLAIPSASGAFHASP